MIKSTYFFALFTLFFAATDVHASTEITPADTTKNIIDKGKIQVAMAKARTLFLENDVRGALNEYKGVLVDDPNNAMAHFRSGECHYHLHNYESALKSLDKAKKADAEVHKELTYYYGLVYHKMEKFDEAIEAYTKFKGMLKGEKQNEEFQVDVFIEQCNYGKAFMAKPVDVTFQNLGRNVNSRNWDYGPVISPDGKTLLITSRRPDSKGGLRTEFDNGFYSDVYESKWDDAAKQWGDLEKVPGKVNTEFWDGASCYSSDGQYLYMTWNIEGATGSTDIYFTKMSGSGKWGTPKPLSKNINTSYFETNPTITADGNTMFFISERPGGQGRGDIWMVEKISKREWGEPVNLGPVVNSPEDENSVWVDPTGRYLFFSSKGHDTMGEHDIFRSEKVDGQWQKPVNLGYPINTVWDEMQFQVSSDGKSAFCSARRNEGLGDWDIYTIDLTNYPVLSPDMKTYTHGSIGGKVVNKEGQGVECSIEFVDKASGAVVRKVQTNERGEYDVALPGNMTYILKIEAQGYKESNEEVELALQERGETRIAKDIILGK